MKTYNLYVTTDELHIDIYLRDMNNNKHYVVHEIFEEYIDRIVTIDLEIIDENKLQINKNLSGKIHTKNGFYFIDSLQLDNLFYSETGNFINLTIQG